MVFTTFLDPPLLTVAFISYSTFDRDAVVASNHYFFCSHFFHLIAISLNISKQSIQVVQRINGGGNGFE